MFHGHQELHKSVMRVYHVMIGILCLLTGIFFVFQENEYVVESALKEFHSSFELQHILPQWEQRGLPVFGGGEYFLAGASEQPLVACT